MAKGFRQSSATLGIIILSAIGFYVIVSFASSTGQRVITSNSVQHDNHILEITQNWGQYSPWFSAPSEISSDTPSSCNITFAQILSRHGSRYPTHDRATPYNATINKIHENTTNYAKNYAFIKDYRYNLGTDKLTLFGQQELFQSGVRFYNRYRSLSHDSPPFIRASGGERVIMSARNWTYGFHSARAPHDQLDPDDLYPILILSEAKDANNPLHHSLCGAFEHGPYKHIASSAQAQWASVFVPVIRDRLNSNLPGADLTVNDTINVMDLCPYNTAASPGGIISPFCDLFSPEEWQQYGYYQSLNKFYGYGSGNYLGPTQGVGFVNELIARMTVPPVNDHTSTNQTLDSDSRTFPYGRRVYADFGHDNDMTSVFFALGLYNSTKMLSNTTLETVEETRGYSAAYTVPFAAHVYIEKLHCVDESNEEMVRVIVNDRIIPLETCGADHLGRCTLNKFVESLSFAKQGGHWNEC